MMPIGMVLDALREWGVEASLHPQIPHDMPATEVMLKCAESSARLMADAQRRRMMQ